MGRQIVVVESSDALSHEAARRMAVEARSAIEARGRFVIALAGGSTVKLAYELLAAEEDIDWGRVLVFWGDERFVDIDNPYRNYALAKAALLDRVPIPPTNIYPVNSKSSNPEAGAADYAATIRDVLGVSGDDMPVFDLIQLGMGPDGHTASLFPHSPPLHPTADKAIVTMNHAGLAPWVDRVTLTLEAINSARSVLVLAGGANKAGRLKEVFEGPNDGIDALPIVGVNPTPGELVWVIDQAAASELSEATLAP